MRPGAEHGSLALPEAQYPGTPASGPGASGRASVVHAGCAVCGDPGGETRDSPRGREEAPGGSASAHGGPPPSWGGRPDSRLLPPPGLRLIPMAGAGPHPARRQALSTLVKYVCVIFNACRLWCVQ